MKFLELLFLCLLFGNTFCNEEGRAPGSTHGDRVFHKYMGMIPDNTGPDGIVTKALGALSGLSGELDQNSGVNNPFGDSKEGNSGSPNVGLIVGLVCLALFVGVGVGVLVAVLVFKGYIPRKCNEGSPNVGLIVGLVCLALFVGVGVGVLVAVLVFKGYIPRKCNEESPAEKTGVARPLRSLDQPPDP